MWAPAPLQRTVSLVHKASVCSEDEAPQISARTGLGRALVLVGARARATPRPVDALLGGGELGVKGLDGGAEARFGLHGGRIGQDLVLAGLDGVEALSDEVGGVGLRVVVCAAIAVST